MAYSMETYLDMALASPLFVGMNRSCAAELFRVTTGRVRTYRVGEVVLAAGGAAFAPPCLFLVLSGRTQRLHSEHGGAQTVVDVTTRGGVFGWEQAYGGRRRFRDAVIAAEDSTVMQLFVPDAGNLSRSWNIFERNLLRIISDKKADLERRTYILSQNSVREKLLAYLSQESERQGNRYFHIPLKRQELADYLCVDRTTLSTELGRMRREGLIDFEKRFFKLPPERMEEGST